MGMPGRQETAVWDCTQLEELLKHNGIIRIMVKMPKIKLNDLQRQTNPPSLNSILFAVPQLIDANNVLKNNPNILIVFPKEQHINKTTKTNIKECNRFHDSYIVL